MTITVTPSLDLPFIWSITVNADWEDCGVCVYCTGDLDENSEYQWCDNSTPVDVELLTETINLHQVVAGILRIDKEQLTVEQILIGQSLRLNKPESYTTDILPGYYGDEEMRAVLVNEEKVRRAFSKFVHQAR